MRITNPLFINTIILGGSPEEKLRAAHQAGFDQVELWRQDVEAVGGDAAAIAAALEAEALTLTDYQVLLDFDGAPDGLRDAKRAEAQRMLDTAVRVGATTLLAPACTHPGCIAARVEEDLRWLAREAGRRGLRVAYEGMAWSTLINTTADAWNMVQQVNEPNLGLVIDAFHIFVRHRTLADLDGIPMDKIYLVQLSDLASDPTPDTLIDTARHHRLLPGQGNYPISALLQRLQAGGYRGPLGLEVFNDDLRAQDPARTAREAMQALRAVCLSTPDTLAH
ncbi:sugar phosphate isomerase/epimerase [Chimaeribacter californicus]|uniref:Sugar phosphate isomerase/epimerase n=1 Tax=Chimaeribacter californicus TaxID=2060067 RepID=A0A2N5DZ70_9GAMM|nr:sugar phosphate isomerase/epimerase family protein [Chimaeribacter californicus]PLR33024.1 sugar phosphate isomerase/epimerase [Chimaeribacter californicus]